MGGRGVGPGWDGPGVMSWVRSHRCDDRRGRSIAASCDESDSRTLPAAVAFDRHELVGLRNGRC